MNIPAITVEQIREVDRLMIETYQIGLIQMMENAGRHLAVLAREQLLDGNPIDKNIVVLAGSGGNGGGGLVAARRLHNWGAIVQVYITRAISDYSGVPSQQLNILKNLGIPIYQTGDESVFPSSDLVLDAIIGYSLKGAPRGQAANLVEMANARDAPILSLDIPSGIDATTGECHQPHIEATATLTLALPKTGLLQSTAKKSVGELYLADIGVPPQLYESMGLDVGPIFAEEEIIRLL